jgi:hypothetical protein
MDGTAHPIADETIRRQGRMKTWRANFESVWQQIAQLVLPRADDFLGKRSPGQRNADNLIFDSTGQLALPLYAAAVEAMVCPRTQKWHSLKPISPDLQDNNEVASYLEDMCSLLFRIRYAPHTNFASVMSESFLSLGAFGNYGVYVEDGLDKGIRYQAVPLTELYWMEDSYGTIDTVHRDYTLTARQAAQKWPIEISEKIRTAAVAEPEREFQFIHCVRPNEERGTTAGWQGYAFAAYDICVDDRTVLEEGGFRKMPYAIGRDVTAPREIYARGPTWNALADLKMLQMMGRDSIRFAQLTLDPPTITADVDSLAAYSRRAGAVNAGYMNDQGVILAKEMPPQADPRPALEVAQQRRDNVGKSLLTPYFQILVDSPQMTATQVMSRDQEKGALLAPTMSRQQETLSVVIDREIDILWHAGVFKAVLGDPPDALILAGGGLAVQFDSPLTRAQRSEEAVGILKTIEAITPLANIDPTIMRRINGDQTLKILSEVNGAPVKWLYTDAQLAQMNQQEAQAEQTKQLTEAAPVITDSLKNLAQAKQAATAAPF